MDVRVSSLYTLIDLEKVRAECRGTEGCWDNYSDNNPNKHYSQRNAAQVKVTVSVP
jgi:hypothetical protein